MLILAIETSCDDTCVAILKSKNRKLKILSNIVSSQVKLHKKYGGIYPFLAKREHQRNLPIVLRKALQGAKLLLREIDLIAVTAGPGLEPCLWTGINFAQELAKKLKISIIPVNHIEAHILANFVSQTQNSKRKTQIFPAICLVVSGGHTQLILMKDIGKYKIIGETRDDAAGECFDKTARILNLGYPGGPIIAVKAAKIKSRSLAKLNEARDEGKTLSEHQKPSPSIVGSNGKKERSFLQPLKISLPRPMLHTKDYDFSFSGLKTAVLYDFKNRSPKTRKSQQYIQEISHEVQQAIIDVLIKKTIKSAKDYKAKSIILGGGVSANEELRKQLKNKIEKEMPYLQYFLPDVKYSTDNAVMIALTGYFNQRGGKNWKNLKADANLRIE